MVARVASLGRVITLGVLEATSLDVLALGEVRGRRDSPAMRTKHAERKTYHRHCWRCDWGFSRAAWEARISCPRCGFVFQRAQRKAAPQVGDADRATGHRGQTDGRMRHSGPSSGLALQPDGSASERRYPQITTGDGVRPESTDRRTWSFSACAWERPITTGVVLLAVGGILAVTGVTAATMGPAVAAAGFALTTLAGLAGLCVLIFASSSPQAAAVMGVLCLGGIGVGICVSALGTALAAAGLVLKIAGMLTGGGGAVLLMIAIIHAIRQARQKAAPILDPTRPPGRHHGRPVTLATAGAYP